MNDQSQKVRRFRIVKLEMRIAPSLANIVAAAGAPMSVGEIEQSAELADEAPASKPVANDCGDVLPLSAC